MITNKEMRLGVCRVAKNCFLAILIFISNTVLASELPEHYPNIFYKGGTLAMDGSGLFLWAGIVEEVDWEKGYVLVEDRAITVSPQTMVYGPKSEKPISYLNVNAGSRIVGEIENGDYYSVIWMLPKDYQY